VSFQLDCQLSPWSLLRYTAAALLYRAATQTCESANEVILMAQGNAKKDFCVHFAGNLSR
jgi:hypothetical protein